ncbi:hypothetical protein BLNAU_22874 [Blattamonas nauphoetae]|uniref:Asparaginase n=1 Tax=Blattamonas nauphoetae TaxID=2049346 RepID=A0ABQ9WRT9_9EUKA|nr:hypothetical protein BLNAU_22874 [Blattamonas nauphoetae]
MEELSRSVTGGQLSITSTIFSDSSATANGAALFLDPSGLTASQLTSLLPRTSMCVDDLAFSKLIVVLPSTLSSASVGSLISPLPLTIFPSSENARSPRDPPHMTAEGSRFHVHPNSHLQYLNTQRITHVVICGTGTTFLASPAKHVSRVCSFLDKALDGDGVILLVSGAMEVTSLSRRTRMKGSFESFTLHNTSFNQAATGSVCAAYCSESEVPCSLAPCVVKLKSSSSTKRPQRREPDKRDGASGIDSAVRRCEETPNAAERLPKLHSTRIDVPQINVQNARTIVGACDDSGIDGSWKPKLSALRTIEQNALRRKDRPGTFLNGMPGRPHSHKPALPAALAHTAHPPSAADSNTDRSRPSSPTLTNPFRLKDHANLNEPPSPVLVTMHRFSRGDALAATLEASPKVGLASTTLPHPPSLPITRKCAFCECEEDNTDNIRREGKAVAARQKRHF